MRGDRLRVNGVVDRLVGCGLNRQLPREGEQAGGGFEFVDIGCRSLGGLGIRLVIEHGLGNLVPHGLEQHERLSRRENGLEERGGGSGSGEVGAELGLETNLVLRRDGIDRGLDDGGLFARDGSPASAAAERCGGKIRERLGRDGCLQLDDDHRCRGLGRGILLLGLVSVSDLADRRCRSPATQFCARSTEGLRRRLHRRNRGPA